MNLRAMRAIKGMTQYDINVKTGIHQSKLSLIERGYTPPKDHEKKKIAAALGVDVVDIEWSATQEV